MHIFKVAAILFVGIATSFKQLDIAPESNGGRATTVDRCNGPVSVCTRHSSSLGALLSGGIYRKQFTRRYFPNVSSKDIIAKVNSLNGTSANEILSLSLYNNMANGVYAYVVGKDVNNRVIILQPDGTFYYPDANGAAAPVKVTQDVKLPLGARGSTFSLNIPAYISSARIYFAVGELQFFVISVQGETTLVEPSAINPDDPSANINWGFVEFTYIQSGVWANISCVDFVGLPLGINLTSITGTV